MHICNYFCNNSSDISRERMRFSYEELHISGVLEHGVCHLLPPNMLASNCQREEVLALLLLVANLDPRPLSNLGNLVASYHVLALVSQGDIGRRDNSSNTCHVSNFYVKAKIKLSGGVHLEVFCRLDIKHDFSFRTQLRNSNQLVKAIWDTSLFGDEGDHVAPIQPRTMLCTIALCTMHYIYALCICSFFSTHM